MLKHTETGLSKSWMVVKRQGASYTGGNLDLLANGTHAACACSDRIALLHLDTGVVERIIPADDTPAAAESITAFAANPVTATVVSSSRNGMIRVWNTETGECVRHWRGHRLPVTVCQYDRTGTLVATGGSDRMVMVWDADHGHATHSFRGHEAVVSVVRFMPHPVTVERLVSGAEDGGVRVWDLITSTCLAAVAEHYSAVTSILFSPDPFGFTMITAGRDRLMAVWNTRHLDAALSAATETVATGDGGKRKKGKADPPGAGGSGLVLQATVPAMEGIEAAVALPPADVARAATDWSFVTAGDLGHVRRWQVGVNLGGARGEGEAWTYRVSCAHSTTVPRLRRGDAGVRGSLLGASSGEGGVPSTTTTTPATGSAPVSHQLCALLLRHTVTAATAPSTACGGGGGDEGGASSGRKKQRGSRGTPHPPPPPATTTPGAGALEGMALLAATRDHVLTTMEVGTLAPQHTVMGYNDDIMDVKYIPSPPTPLAAVAAAEGKPGTPVATSRIAMATNSEQLRLVDVSTFDTRLCDGHTDVIMSVAVSPEGSLVATASKDRTARVWDVATGRCITVCEGHTETVTCVAWPAKGANFARSPASSVPLPAGMAATAAAGWLATAGHDRTLKTWQLGPLLSTLPIPRPADWDGEALTAATAGARAFTPRTLAAVVAHEKDINSVAVAPNDRLLATGSQDKTIKLWSLPGLTCVGTLNGHRRGVWCVAFSPADQVLASASGDRTVRIWSVNPTVGFTCLHTLEGHDASALSVQFLRRGQQVMSGGADGLVKLWNVKDGECVNTFDAHTGKVWTLAMKPVASGTPSDAGVEVEMVTGGGDSLLNVWSDVTSQEVEGEVVAREELAMKQQTLFTAMATRDYRKAIHLTLELDQPHRCGEILVELVEQGPKPKTVGVPAPVLEARYRDDMLREMAEMAEEAAGWVHGGVGDDLAAWAGGRGAPREGAGGAVRGQPLSSAAVVLHALQARGGGGAAGGATSAGAAGLDMLTAVVSSLSPLQLGRLLGYVREWNTQSRHGLLAHQIITLLLRRVPRRAWVHSLMEVRAQAGLMQVVPGLGTLHRGKATGALALLDTLAPVVGGVVPDSSQGSGAMFTGAAAEFHAFLSSLLPYADRHGERMDRLLVSSHLIDSLLAGMRVLRPSLNDITRTAALSRMGAAAAARAANGGIAAASKSRVFDPAADSSDEDDSDDAMDPDEVAAVAAGGPGRQAPPPAPPAAAVATTTLRRSTRSHSAAAPQPVAKEAVGTKRRRGRSGSRVGDD